MNQKGVLEFLEEMEGKRPPKKTTVQRTTNSKYLFYLVVRYYRIKLRLRPNFLPFVKGEALTVKGQIEEHSVFSSNEGNLYVLEGYDTKFVDQLSLPEGTYVVAETTEGELKPETYNFYTQRRNILKVLVDQLGLKTPLTLSALLKLDWSLMKSFDDFEPILRKAKLMGWGPEDLTEDLESKISGNPLIFLKKGQAKDLLEIADQIGSASTYNFLLNFLADLIHFRVLSVMGYDKAKCQREMDISWKRAEQLEEASNMIPQQDLQALTSWIIKLDRRQFKAENLHLAVLVGRNPIQVRR